MAKIMWRCDSCRRIYPDKQNAGGLSAGKAAVGALAFGPAGAIVGAAMGKTATNNNCPYCGSYCRTMI